MAERNSERAGRMETILHIIKGYEFLEIFLSSADASLSLPKEDTRKILQDELVVERFQVRQYRAKPRRLPRDKHVDFQPQEPVPLEFLQHLGNGPLAEVDKVRNILTGEEFALKRTRVINPDNGSDNFQEQLIDWLIGYFTFKQELKNIAAENLVLLAALVDAPTSDGNPPTKEDVKDDSLYEDNFDGRALPKFLEDFLYMRKGE
ncbi:hypothetical protein K469DRAFT_686426 [Zopfia rhizophila CBS 207.26]|uniref:Uncharacterized protein n=1 Tax=Zopfia rhizophila CBS 207.26 TaxID=1314779 RepID=A0A6A6ES35_9PEZI|nr:hypothetical protein K469DRAFT_686426 [Zopfia rhizophila CBS 207.26]